MTDTENGADDTVQTTLSDDLLEQEDSATSGLDQASSASTDDETVAEDDYLQPGAGHRSRLTTGLIVALIFALGALSGAVLTRLLTPDPPPQVVYVLNGEGTSPSPSTTGR